MRDNRNFNVLIIDDEKYICDVISEALSSQDYRITATSDPRSALRHIEQNPVDLVLTDLMMGECSGEQILDATLTHHSDAVVILMTAFPTVEIAIAVMKKGAYDFLIKPFKLDLLKVTVARGLKHQRLLRENLSLKGQVELLKIANASQIGVDIESFLRLVLSACKKELAVVAAGLLEIDPDTKEPVRKICEADDDGDRAEVLANATFEQFAYTKSPRPLVQTCATPNQRTSSARTFISQPIFIRRRLHGVINLLVSAPFDRVTPGQVDALTLLANSAGSAIANQKLYQDLQSSYLQAIRGLANAIEARDQCTRGHTERVSKLATLVAQHLGWSQVQIHHLIMGCTLHDIGKIGVPDSLLNKSGKFTDEERQWMSHHPEMGLKIIQGIDLFKPAIPYIIAHHERYDGSGYPRRLKGEEIPIEGRLLAVVDAFDAIMANRPYRRGATLQFAISELLAHKETQFDPRIVDTFIDLLRADAIDLQEMYGCGGDVGSLCEAPVTETAPV
ncbi:MAG TPA: HD domain-containing phosphohydrolase [Candidatus Deferrimicrobium sp.]|nr:HD domain-containing phosphohydrolase [Candidatus Deferrimicrobium sp.]